MALLRGNREKEMDADVKAMVIGELERLIQRIKDGETKVVSIQSSRGVIEKPVSERGEFYKEYKPSQEYRIELTLVNVK